MDVPALLEDLVIHAILISNKEAVVAIKNDWILFGSPFKVVLRLRMTYLGHLRAIARTGMIN